MGANQSTGLQTGKLISGDNNRDQNASGILVVNPTPGTRQPGQDIILPPRVPPILTLEGNHIDPKRHRPDIDQLNPKLWIEFAANIGEFSDSRADLVAKRQSQLQEKIVQIDDHVQKFTESYVTEQHRALARLNDDCKKMDEIEKMVQKCTTQSELCVSMLNKLNFLLPDDKKLEPLEP